MRSLFFRNWRSVVFVIIALGLVALALSGYMNPVIRVLLSPLVETQTWVYERYNAIQLFLTAPSDLSRLRQRNEELEAENSRLQIEVIELQQQVVEAQVLATLVNYARSSSENKFVASSVIGYDTSPFMKYVFINRGSDDGLQRGMPVVTDKGLVGQIAAVTANAARVQLIVDTGSSINVHLQQADTEAVLIGQVTGEVELDMIPQSATVQVGDLVVTSGLGGNFPPNLVIGQIANVRRRDFDLFQTAAVQPAVDFRNLEIVLIITNFKSIDISPLIPNTEEP